MNNDANDPDAHDAMIELLMRAIDALPITYLQSLDLSQARAIMLAADDLDPNLASFLRDAFAENIPDF